MKELNKHILNESLKKLPEMNPPEMIWEKIEFELEGEKENQRLQERLVVLPEYNPPEEVWGRIVRELDNGAKVVKIANWKKAISIAAVGLILIFGVNYFNGSEVVNGTMSYSEETVENNLLAHDWDEDEAAFEEFKTLCKSKKYVCKTPEFLKLQEEFEELNEARVALKEALGTFGTNPDLIIQMKEIELERTDIFKTMIAMVI